jgi:predicted MFS family arabinose efflux permease
VSEVLPIRSPAHSLALSAWAVRFQFFIAGALFATWGVHVPTIKSQYGLSQQSLALAMLASGVGALLALAQAGRLIGRWGPRRVARVAGAVCCAAVACLLAFDHDPELLAVLLVFGISTSLFDVAINAEASRLERSSQRPLMSGFHAMFSLGGMAGAGAGSVIAGMTVSPMAHLVGAALVALVSIQLTCMAMPKRQAPAEGDAAAPREPLSLPRGPLMLLGILAAMGMVAEGAMYDWSVLFMKLERHVDASQAALAYASFSGAMALGRLFGDSVRRRFSGQSLMRTGGAVAAMGMALGLFVPVPGVALVAFALVGLGLSNVVPVLFSTASHIPGISPAHGIASVSSLAYLGMMAGPPIIGMLAEHWSLTVGLFTVVVFAAFMSLLAGRALRVG